MLGGKHQPWTAISERLLHERYGVAMTRHHYCCPTEYESHYARAYNERISRHLAETFPAFSIHDLFDDAHREWESTASR
jgi:hypothetical protein